MSERDEFVAQMQAKMDEYTSSLQQHSTGGPVTAGTMMFHGQGAAALLRFPLPSP